MRTFRSVKTRLALTPGDLAGIGPEVLVKALSRWDLRRAQVLVLSDASYLNGLAKRLRCKVRFAQVEDPKEDLKGVVPCYFDRPFPKKIRLGLSQNELTKSAVRSIELAAKLAMKGVVGGIVTPPINKAGLKKAGFSIPGHTEFLAKLSGAKKYEMMLVGGKLRTVLVTRHTPLAEVPKKISAKRVEEVILLADRELRRSFGIRRPRLVVCGLNPHAGEEGTIGKEELKYIAPAVRSARRKTDAVIMGPLSPDALFVDAYLGRYDAEICMYHDQGLIPLKMISRGHGVNVTLGLPFARTSPDHGTAYDIARKGVADPGSMLDAMTMAADICRRRLPAGRQGARR